MKSSITPSIDTLCIIGALLIPTSASAALQVENNPGNMTSPTGTVSVSIQTINPIPEINIINSNANFGGNNAGGFSSVYLFRSTDDPSVASTIHASTFRFHLNNNGAGSFDVGAQAGDDNWLYICRKEEDVLVFNGWVKLAITSTTFDPILYVHDPTNPATLITLPQAVAAATAPPGSPRDVQIKSVDFNTGIIELHNFGSANQNLDGWRFCTHDENEVLKYSGAGGLNGITIEAGTSLNIHFNNDAPAVDSDNLNRSSLGGAWAGPLDASAYGMALYMNSNFGSGAAMADYAQWNFGGTNNATADERADEAVAGGVWTSTAHWIPTSSGSDKIFLTDGSAAELHSNSDYLILPDFRITSISRNSASNEVSLAWPVVNNLEVTVESSSTLSSPDWPDQTTTSASGVTLTGQTNSADFYRLLFVLP